MSTLNFEYNAIDRSGTKRRGTTRATDKADAYRRLAASGLTPVSIRALVKTKRRTKRVKAKDLAHFTYQFGVLVGARIPLSEALLSISQQEADPYLAGTVADIAARVEAGENLSVAMNAHVTVFGEMYIQTVKAAERTGNITKVMEHLSDMLEKTAETIQQVKSALMYPAIVILVLCSGCTFLIGVVIPKFARMFESRGVELPTITKLLIVVGDSFHDYWWAYLLFAAGVVFTIRAMRRSVSGRMALDKALHRIPYISKIIVGLAMSRFTRVLGLSLGSGLGLIECLDLAGRSTGRPMLMKDVEQLIAQVRNGGRLMDCLPGCHYMTPFTSRMLSVGEDSAELPRMCSIVARHYDRETTVLTKNIATIIEPVMIVMIAVIVLLVALGIFLPMWNMVTLLG